MHLHTPQRAHVTTASKGLAREPASTLHEQEHFPQGALALILTHACESVRRTRVTACERIQAREPWGLVMLERHAHGLHVQELARTQCTMC